MKRQVKRETVRVLSSCGKSYLVTRDGLKTWTVSDEGDLGKGPAASEEWGRTLRSRHPMPVAATLDKRDTDPMGFQTVVYVARDFFHARDANEPPLTDLVDVKGVILTIDCEEP